MAKPETPDRPKPKLRVGRIFGVLLVLGVGAAGAYAASWLNAHRYFLVVTPGEARVQRGRMFPVGSEPYFPEDPLLRRAYGPIELPGGLGLSPGETRFDERADLDDAVRRLLKRAMEHVLNKPTDRTPVLAAAYLSQLEALPGASVTEEKELDGLRRAARRAEAQLLLSRAKGNLEQAAKLLRAADPSEAEAKRRAQALEGILGTLRRLDVAPTPTSTRAPTASSTVAQP